MAEVSPGLKTRLDYDDYLATPDDGRRYEILDGELYVTPAPSPLHQRASKRLQRQLEAYFEAGGRGEVFDAAVDLILTRHDVVQPDLVVVTDPSQVTSRAIEGVPALVVEVLSPYTRDRDRGVKGRRYAALGVLHYWLLDPDARRLECFRLEAGAYVRAVEGQEGDRLTHPAWPGLEVALGDLWR